MKIRLTFLLCCLSWPAWAQEARTPEIVSLLGKPYYANPADDEVRAAEKALSETPDDPERMIAAARAYDRVLQFSRSIPLYTRAIGLLPEDVRAYRYRGHRYISTRRFREAAADLEKAERLAPDSFDVLYHLGLAYYLDGRFGEAADAYGRCLNYRGPASGRTPEGWRNCAGLDDDSRIAMMNWYYAALRRAGRHDQAGKLLEGVRADMAVKENAAYLLGLLYYKGERTESELGMSKLAGSSMAALAYPIANFALIQGERAKACELFRKLVADDSIWNAFGFIAAEVELARPGTCK